LLLELLLLELGDMVAGAHHVVETRPDWNFEIRSMQG
jgi:hypothetical protein